MNLKHILSVFACTLTLFMSTPITNGQNPPEPTPIVTPAPQVKYFVDLSGVTFVDAQHGWMLSHYDYFPTEQYEFTVDHTTDGGQTWQVLSVLCAGSWTACSSPTSAPQVNELRFANLQDGWAFSPELYSTHDGGTTWNKEAVNGTVWALEVTNGKVWTLQGVCATDFPSWCNLNVITSADNGQTWQSSQPLPEMRPEKLVVLDSETALVLYFPAIEKASGPNTPEPEIDYGELATESPRIIATSDGGSTWQALSFPAACDGYWNIFDLAATDRQNLWFACGSIGAGPWGAKRVLTSSDGGQSWQLKAKVNLPEEPDYNITSYGALINLYTFSAQSAWMMLYRADPIVTNDGGQSWQTLTIAPAGATQDLSDKRLIWVDPDHIWYVNADQLYSTHDGGLTWVCQRTVVDYSFGTGCPEAS
ncbi:MAG: hypothetical protein ABI690_22500 [Chloroflexota bacterium]